MDFLHPEFGNAIMVQNPAADAARDLVTIKGKNA
jgi:hypothetical protein